MGEFEVVLEVFFTILYLSQVIQVLIVLLENRHQSFGLLRQLIGIYLKRNHLFLFYEDVHHAHTCEILKIELPYWMLPSECTIPGQLEILLKDACPELLYRIHAKCKLANFL